VTADFRAMPAAAPRRRIIRHASGWLIGVSDNDCRYARVLCGTAGPCGPRQRRPRPLMQPDCPSGTARPEVFDLHL
jgi:hypothetical protein